MRKFVEIAAVVDTFCDEAGKLHCLAGLSQCRAKSDFDLKNPWKKSKPQIRNRIQRGKQCVFNMESMDELRHRGRLTNWERSWDAAYQAQETPADYACRNVDLKSPTPIIRPVVRTKKSHVRGESELDAVTTHVLLGGIPSDK